MNNEQKQDFQKTGVILEERIIRIANDNALEEALRSDPRSGSYHVADQIRADYEEKYGRSMPFSVRSLACEIYWHYQAKLRSEKYENKHGRKKFTSWLLGHMAVIDCGDRKADNNRFVWDLLGIFFPRKGESHAEDTDQQDL